MLASSGVTSSHVHTFYSFFIAHKIHQDSSSVKGLFVDFVSPLCAASSHILPELMQLPIGRIPARVSPFCHAAYQGFCCPEIWNPIPWFTNGCHHTHRMAARWTKEKPLQKKQKTRHQTCTAWLGTCWDVVHVCLKSQPIWPKGTLDVVQLRIACGCSGHLGFFLRARWSNMLARVVGPCSHKFMKGKPAGTLYINAINII